MKWDLAFGEPPRPTGGTNNQINRVTMGIECFVLLRHMPFVNYESWHDKPDETTYPFLSPNLKEVEMSCKLQWVSGKYIKAIAFVFQIDQVNECRYACSGIRNAFYI
jgi:hypothetical protein